MTPETKTMTGGGGRWLVGLLLVVGAVFYGLGFVHLRADFPNGSPWMDWSKISDEGWYGGAAVQHYLLGNWYVKGPFNPAVAMPVWPLMLAGWFKVFGVNMTAARSLTMVLYGVSLGLLFAVVRRAAGAVAGALAVVVTVVNPFCFAFDRLAVLEPVVVFWMMLGLWMAGRTGRKDYGRQVLLGVLVVVLVLSKTTGVAVVPALLYMMWAGQGGLEDVARIWGAETSWVAAVKGWLTGLAVVCGVGMGLWLVYFNLAVKPHYLADYKLLFSINNYRVHLRILPRVAWETVGHLGWIGGVLVAGVLLVLAASVGWLRKLWLLPLFGAAVMAVAGQLAFIGYHGNFQPRYYLVAAMPMAIVLVLGVCALWEQQRTAMARKATVSKRSGVALNSPWTLGLVAGLVFGFGEAATKTVGYVLHPEYSFLNAAESIAAVANGDQSVKPMVFSGSCGEISLLGGVPTVCDAYLSDGIDDVMDRYRPGWNAVWVKAKDEGGLQREVRLGERYRGVEVARYRVFDDPEMNLLVLYKVTPQ